MTSGSQRYISLQALFFWAPWSRVPFWYLAFAELVNTFYAFYGTKKDYFRLMYSIFPALMTCRILLKDRQMHFGFMGVILLHSGQQHVSATHVAIFRVVRIKTQIQFKLV
jgi:hypothetical protein